MKPTLRWILFVSGLSVCFPIGGQPELHAQNAPTATLAAIGNAAPERQVTIQADLPGTPQRIASWTNQTDLASLKNVLTPPSLLNKSNLRKYKIAPFNNHKNQGPSAISALTEIMPVTANPEFSMTGLQMASDALAVNRDEKATLPVTETNEEAAMASRIGQFSVVTLNDCKSELSEQEELENSGLPKPAEQSFKIFPNPVREYVLVRILRQLNAPFQVLVMAENGACMQELRCSQGNAGDQWFVNTEDLHAGVYFLRVNSGTSTLVKRVYIL